MTAPLRSIRLYPTETEFLDQYRMNVGDIFYDKDKNTLVIYDGVTKGGLPLLRADLSNISGGGSVGAGVINFGDSSIQAQAFIGDGSQLTNLPIPSDVATVSDVETAFNTPATTASLGTVKIGSGLSVTPDGTLSADAFQEVSGFSGLEFLSFVRGVQISEFSSDTTLSGNENDTVPTERAVKTYVDTQISLIDLDANGTVSTANAGQLAFYENNGKVVIGSGTKLLWNSSNGLLSVDNLTIANDLSTTKITVNGNGNINGDLIVDGDVAANSIFNDGLGIAKFEFGADLIFDALGDINVSGSKITNLGAPSFPTDAVNKAYVDGAAAQFTGGDVPNNVRILSGTASSSPTTGALVVSGGVGVTGEIRATGSIFVDGSPVLTSLSGGFNGGTISGTLFINNSTASTSTTTGALRVTGGVGIGRSIVTGGDSFFNGIRFGNGADIGSGFAQNISIGGGSGINSPLSSNVSGVNDIAIGFSALGQLTGGSDNIAIGVQAMANRQGGERSLAIGSDALLNSQGNNNLGVGHSAGSEIFTGGGNVVIGGNTGSTIDELNNHVIIADGVGNIKLQFNNVGAVGFGSNTYGSVGQILTSSGSEGAPIWTDPIGFDGGTISGDTVFTSTTPSTSTTTGAVRISGGLGVSGEIYSGGLQNTPIGSTTRSSGAFTTLTSNAATTFTASTASSSISTGTLVVTGGVGISGAVNVGSAISVGGVGSFTSNTASNSTTTGSVVITGGLGVSGTVNAASFVGNGSGLTNITASVFSGGTVANATTFSSTVTFNGNMSTNNTAVFSMGSGTRQMLNLWGTTYALGVQNNTLYYRSAGTFRWFRGGVHNNNEGQAGTGGVQAMVLDASSNLTATGNVTAFSDERLKENITVIPNALEKLMTLDGVTFVRKDTGQKGTGLVAQALQKVLPEAVITNEDGYLSVAYGNTVGLLIEAIKEQQRQIEELKNQIKFLKEDQSGT